MAYIGAGISRFNTADELTVTGDAQIDTTTLVVDSTNNRVGVGTASPSTLMHLKQITDNAILRINSDSGERRIDFGDSSDDDGGRIKYDGSDNMLLFTNGSERLRIESDGNLRVNDSIDNLTGTLTLNGRNTGNILFQSGGNEKMRLDSSGNLLVGKTTTDFNTEGHKIGPSGEAANFVRDGNIPLLVNRLTSDGECLRISKDGSTVGSIGVSDTSFMYIGGSGSTKPGFYFNDADRINPVSNGARSDNTTDLGQSNYRFKDLYLSGGAYIGGTGSANKLDDYEEGTWTPSFTSTGATFSYGVQGGNYTKVGRLVMCSFRVSLSAAPTGTTSAVVFLSGLPFSSATLSQTYHGGSIGHYFNFNLSATGVLAYQTVSGTSTTELKVVGDNLGETGVLASHLNSGAEIRGQVIYHAS